MKPGNVDFSLTKNVARELNLIEKICVNKNENSNQPAQQRFQFLIVIDFESTCWKDNRNGNQPEIIEFPAVLLNVQTGIIEEEFQRYVLPVENPILSEFCTKLTGIKQEDVENGVPLRTCISFFSCWIKEISEKRRLIFHKNLPVESKERACTFVTWSDWDLSVCLHNECRRKQLYKPEILCQWIDLRATYREFYKRRPQGLRGALSELGLQFEGQEHSGLWDARNTALLAWRMTQDGAVLKITKSLLTNKNSPDIQEKHIVLSKTQCNKNSLKEDQKEAPQLHVKLKMSRQPLKPVNTSLTAKRKSSITRDMECSSHLPGTPILGHCREVVSLRNRKSNRNDMNKGIVSRRNMSNITPGCNIKQKMQFLQSTKTPDSAIRPGPSTSCKRTPPLCKCGSRASRRIASLPGPNQGRSFFSCPKRKYLGMLQMAGCGFFHWEFY